LTIVGCEGGKREPIRVKKGLHDEKGGTDTYKDERKKSGVCKLYRVEKRFEIVSRLNKAMQKGKDGEIGIGRSEGGGKLKKWLAAT